jgi:hypothetical protein
LPWPVGASNDVSCDVLAGIVLTGITDTASPGKPVHTSRVIVPVAEQPIDGLTVTLTDGDVITCALLFVDVAVIEYVPEATFVQENV